MTLKQQYAHMPTAELKRLRADPALSPYAALLLVEELHRRKIEAPLWRRFWWWLSGGCSHER